MKESVVAWLMAGILVLFGITAFSQSAPPRSFAVSDLKLISTASKPDWSDRWSGPVEGATILTWFHDHGFPAFLPDLNGDGVINELDTIELADRLGKGSMKTQTPVGTTDARLVRGLAEYVAKIYPGKFELKIYDRGFPAEFNREFGVPFASDAIPGITLTLTDAEPNFPAYKKELESAEGVIIGIEQNQRPNYYFAGRSFLFEKTAQGNYGIDLAWGKDDPWTAGIQGQVLKTEARQTDAWYIFYQGKWAKVEFMLALSPIIERDKDTSKHGPCADDAIGYDVSTSSTRFGDVRIEECVTRDGDVDTYTYTVTNLSFTAPGGCGICQFKISNTAGLTTLNQTGPGTWLINPFSPAGWQWVAPLGSCGIKVGESAVFSFSVPAPTADVPVKGQISPCGSGLNGGWEIVPVFLVDTTGPGEAPPEKHCPDLTIQVDRSSCSCAITSDKRYIKCTVDVYATVKNIGDQDATGFYCSMASSIGGDQILVPIVAAGGTEHLHFSTYTLIPNTQTAAPQYPCPVNFTVVADSKYFIAECDEENNTDSGTTCCP